LQNCIGGKASCNLLLWLHIKKIKSTRFCCSFSDFQNSFQFPSPASLIRVLKRMVFIFHLLLHDFILLPMSFHYNLRLLLSPFNCCVRTTGTSPNRAKVYIDDWVLFKGIQIQSLIKIVKCISSRYGINCQNFLETFPQRN
jgi:hypothetical protein